MAFRWYIYILIYYKRTNRVSNRILSQAGSGNSVLFPQSTASLVCFWHRWVTCFHHVTTKHSALIVGEIIQEKTASAFTAEGFCQHTWDISGVWIDGSMDGLWSLNVIEGAAPTVFFFTEAWQSHQIPQTTWSVWSSLGRFDDRKVVECISLFCPSAPPEPRSKLPVDRLYDGIDVLKDWAEPFTCRLFASSAQAYVRAS